MKVTSGIRKGALLEASRDLSVRPTADKVKQSVFNMIQFEIPGRTVLDLFAGSGALGIEALSRGAKHCTFVDLNPEFVKRNIQKLRFEEMSEIVRGDYLEFLGKQNRQFDLVFLDPPYEKKMIDAALKILVEKNLLTAGAIIVWESDASEEISVPPSIEITKERTFGRIQTRIGVWK